MMHSFVVPTKGSVMKETKTKETIFPRGMEDFEEGDEVYQVSTMSGDVFLGVIAELHDPVIIVSGTDGRQYAVHIDAFTDRTFFIDQLDQPWAVWGKLLPVAELKVGSVISQPGKNRERVYVTITELVHPAGGSSGRLTFAMNSLVSTLNAGRDLKTTYLLKDEDDLKRSLVYWELED